MNEKAKHSKPETDFFDLPWDSDAEAEDAAPQVNDQDAGDDDVEAHGFSGFNLPE